MMSINSYYAIISLYEWMAEMRVFLYIYAFSRHFYPKRLTVHSGYTCFMTMCVPWESNPQPFALLTQCSTTEPQEHFTTHTLYHTHTLPHTLKRTWRSWWFQPLQSQWGHKHTYIISRTALRVTSSAFHRFIWVKLASYHVHTEM